MNAVVTVVLVVLLAASLVRERLLERSNRRRCQDIEALIDMYNAQGRTVDSLSLHVSAARRGFKPGTDLDVSVACARAVRLGVEDECDVELLENEAYAHRRRTTHIQAIRHRMDSDRRPSLRDVWIATIPSWWGGR